MFASRSPTYPSFVRMEASSWWVAGLFVLGWSGCSTDDGSGMAGETDAGTSRTSGEGPGETGATAGTGGTTNAVDETGADSTADTGPETGSETGTDTEGDSGDGDALDLSTCQTWAEGLDEEDDGATRDFYNRAAGLPWRNFLGDWLDSAGVEQGEAAYATATLTDDDTPETASFDVTALVQQWVDGEQSNRGFFLRRTSGSGPFVFASREHADGATHPVLVLETGAGQMMLSASADTSLRESTFQAAGQEPTLRIVDEEPALLRFDLSDVSAGSVQSATLQLTSVEEFGGGAFDVGVFEAAAGPLTAAPAAEPGLAADYGGDAGIEGDPSVVFASTFEQDDWGAVWSAGSDATNLAVIDAEDGFEPLSGRALKVTLPAGENGGLNLRHRFMEEEGEEPEAIYLRYYLRFADSWEPSDGGKLPGTAGTYGVAGWGGRPVDGTDGWSARGQYRVSPPQGNPFEGHTTIGNYVYHADMEGQFGDNENYLDHCGGVLDKNRWYSVEQYVQLNTPGENDGIIRAWVDGRLVEEKTDWRWRDVDTLRIEEVWMNVYHGGTDTAPQDLVLYIDNVVVSHAYVGPME